MTVRQRCITLGSLFALGAALVSCRKPDATAGPPPMPPTAVTIALPVKQTVTEWDEFTGRLDASESVTLFSQVTGYLDSIHFVDGSEVKKGDLLFKIDARPFQAVLSQAEAQLEQTKVRLELAKNEFNRADRLVKTKAISAEEFDTKSKAVREAEAGVRVSQATVDKAALDVEYTEIKAPLDGRIGRKLMDVGGLVIGGPMGATELASIVALDPIYCYIDADELSILRYQRLNREGNGQAMAKEDRILCEMALADSEGFPFKGVIDFVDNRMDPNTGTIRVRAVFENPLPQRGQRELHPGYFARVRVPGGGTYEALLVDERAIGSSQAQKVLMIVGEGNIVMPRTVTLGPSQNGKRVVRTGLKEGEKVVINGLAKIQPGMPVTPLTEEEAAQAAGGATAQNGH